MFHTVKSCFEDSESDPNVSHYKKSVQAPLIQKEKERLKIFSLTEADPGVHYD